MLVPRRAVAALALALLTPSAQAQSVKLTAGDVEDTRASIEGWGGLSIELKLAGDGVAEVKGLRVKLKSARDDRGTALFKPDPAGKPGDFEEFSSDRRPGPTVRVLSPARGASSVDVSGEVELFMPKRDPGTKQTVEKFQSRLDKPIVSSALKAAKIEITPLSPAEYKTRSAKRKPSKEEIAAEGKKHGASEKEIQQMMQMMEALSALGPGEDVSDTNAVFDVKDPEGRLLGLEVVNRDGTEIHASGRSSSGGKESKLMKLDLAQKPPDDAALLLTVRTPKSVVSVPLAFNEVVLP
jgi:hypothetical protein